VKVKEGRWGLQPAKSIINRNAAATYLRDTAANGRIPEAAELLTDRLGFEVKPRTLQAYLDGHNVPPAEIRLGLAELLDRDPAQCWTADVLAATYVGPRGFGSSGAPTP
jgi:hypothetical protein